MERRGIKIIILSSIASIYVKIEGPSVFPLAHHPDRHIVKRFNDFFTGTAPEMLLGKTDDFPAAHHNGADILVGFLNNVL